MWCVPTKLRPFATLLLSASLLKLCNSQALKLTVQVEASIFPLRSGLVAYPLIINCSSHQSKMFGLIVTFPTLQSPTFKLTTLTSNF